VLLRRRASIPKGDRGAEGVATDRAGWVCNDRLDKVGTIRCTGGEAVRRGEVDRVLGTSKDCEMGSCGVCTGSLGLNISIDRAEVAGYAPRSNDGGRGSAAPRPIGITMRCSRGGVAGGMTWIRALGIARGGDNGVSTVRSTGAVGVAAGAKGVAARRALCRTTSGVVDSLGVL